MDTKNFLITAIGEKHLDILSRITTLFMQRHIMVDSVLLETNEDDTGTYKVQLTTTEESVKSIIYKIQNIIGITTVEYK